MWQRQQRLTKLLLDRPSLDSLIPRIERLASPRCRAGCDRGVDGAAAIAELPGVSEVIAELPPSIARLLRIFLYSSFVQREKKKKTSGK
jgi:hypothetical protein